tara:strand:- start:682 stop:1362 length:681 start_codon:yes stop_codon:yes gene_type:complete
MALDAVTATGSLILNPLLSLWAGFITILPGIVAAIIILIIGYFVALGLGHLVRIILERAGLNSYMEKHKMAAVVGHIRGSHVFGEIVKWYVFIIFIQAAVDLLNLGTLSMVLNEFVLWLPNVIVAAVVIIFGVGLSHYVGMKIEEHTEMKGTRFLSRLLKLVIVFLVVVVALGQIGVEVGLIENTFLILIGALAIGISIALGIGLGKSVTLNGKRIVKDLEELIHH